ncbi:MAG: 1-deoxy-D-xylulose-5-phosphate reductoisomerase [Anaerovoracaceae bacterium]|jgi:1-deoxy-D-xylulose-5-phosphate reductoisomerase|nr:1-deoxy-D-xylulose-5-phosphate reductoisomerase [Anaerovoracaceae bacterium]
MKRICILGSTGSIGTQALEIIENNQDLFRASVLSCGTKVEMLIDQINTHHPDLVVVKTPEQAQEVQVSFPSLNVLYGEKGLIEAASIKWDIVLNSLVGMKGLAPTYFGILGGNPIALANKETLVVGGEIVMGLAAEKNVAIIPVDSEHSAIFQCLMGNHEQEVKRLILTASGGPFRGYKREDLENVTLKQTLNHPKWKMGKKITVDSATMMNKGLEIIEAKWLFDMAIEKIEVLVHPQSIVHSMVEFMDTSIMAQLGCPDMKIPIALAFSYPKRLKADYPSLNFLEKASSLTFEAPDDKTFSCLRLAKEAGEKGGSYPIVLNAANEVLVDRFLAGKISFLNIQEGVEEALQKHSPSFDLDLEKIIEIDEEVRKRT